MLYQENQNTAIYASRAWQRNRSYWTRRLRSLLGPESAFAFNSCSHSSLFRTVSAKVRDHPHPGGGSPLGRRGGGVSIRCHAGAIRGALCLEVGFQGFLTWKIKKGTWKHTPSTSGFPFYFLSSHFLFGYSSSAKAFVALDPRETFFSARRSTLTFRGT